MTKNVIRYFFLLLSILFFPFVVDVIYHKIALPYFQLLLYTASFCFLALFLVIFLEKYPKLKMLISNFVVFILLLCFAEFFFYFLNEKSDVEIKYNTTDLITKQAGILVVPDSVLGYRMKPDLKFSSVMTADKDTVYSSFISSGFRGWRTTLFDSAKNKNAIFLGCSFTFGAGLNDEETLPYLIGQNSNYNTYNFAFGGYGPQQAMLLFKRNFGLLPGSENTKVIYIYIDGHIRRVTGSFSIVNSYGKDFPYPELSDDSLVIFPSFKEKSPFLFSFYSALIDCQTVEYFNVDFPLFLSDRHFDLCGKTIEKLAEEVKEKCKTELIVVVYPGSLQHKKVLSHIDEKLVKVLDYSTFCEKGNEKYFFKNDGHPNPLLNKIIADRILKDIFR